MQLTYKRLIILLFCSMTLFFFSLKVFAENSSSDASLSLKSLKTIRRKDGINSQEAILIARHCLVKSPFQSAYKLEEDEIHAQEKSEKAYEIFFAPVNGKEDSCSLHVIIDRNNGDSVLECSKGDNPFILKSGYVETEDKQKIHYDHYQNGHKRVVILVHGFYNSKEAILFKRMAKDLYQDYDVIMMDMRGHGLSTGLFTWTAKSPKDLETIIQYALKQYKSIGVIGFSLGAATSIITVAESKSVDSLIAVSAPTAFSKIDGEFWTMGIEENIMYNVFQEGRIGKGVRPGLLWLKKIKPIDVVDRIDVPTLFLHGKKDWLINPWHSEDLYAKAKCQKSLRLIDGGTHAEYLYRHDPEKIMAIFKEWLNKTLKEEKE